MGKEIRLLNVNDFKNANIKNVEIVSESVYKIVKDSLLTGKVSTLESSFQELSTDFEKISNCIDLDNPNRSVCYHFGRVAALTNIVLEISGEHEKTNILNNISKSYTLLIPALQIIKKHNMISGVDLQKELKLKSSSNLSNFLKRISKYDLVTVRKIGTINYISLTEQGEKLLYQSNNSLQNNDSELTFTQLHCILDGLIEELSNTNGSSINIVHNCVPPSTSVREKRLLKQKIDRIFFVRDVYIRTKFKNIGNNNEIWGRRHFNDYTQDGDFYEIKVSY